MTSVNEKKKHQTTNNLKTDVGNSYSTVSATEGNGKIYINKDFSKYLDEINEKVYKIKNYLHQ